MNFGSVENPGQINFSLPENHPETDKLLSKVNNSKSPGIYVGCAKWSRKDLKNFYPRGTKDELEYYSNQFNAIELNATFYRNFSAKQVQEWYDKTPEDFRFFPKVHQRVSHLKWLKDFEQPSEDFLSSVMHLKEKLGTVFLQMRDNFGPKYMDRLQNFVEWWPKDVPLAIELRHPEWFSDATVFEEMVQLLEENKVANVLVDTAGRRDMLHMRLTNNEVFVRYVGANHETDYSRLDGWVDRLEDWTDQGLQNIYFFVHQNEEVESPVLAAHFIQQLNERLGTDLKIPQTTKTLQKGLF
ncbi:MAG: DUF72 domain-containing protein [Balneolaceae bacterium]